MPESISWHECGMARGDVMLATADKLRLLGLAKEIRAVLLMYAEGCGSAAPVEDGEPHCGLPERDVREGWDIRAYVHEILEIAELLAAWITEVEGNEAKTVEMRVCDGKRRTVDAREQLKMLGFIWDPKAKMWKKSVTREEAEELLFSDELKDLTVSFDEEWEP